MAMQMVDIDQRYIQCQCQPLAERSAHMQRPRQPRTTRKSNGINLFALDSRLTNRFGHDGYYVLLMSS